MRFFDVTPSGQILNRFSKDMDEGLKLFSYFPVAKHNTVFKPSYSFALRCQMQHNI